MTPAESLEAQPGLSLPSPGLRSGLYLPCPSDRVVLRGPVKLTPTPVSLDREAKEGALQTQFPLRQWRCGAHGPQHSLRLYASLVPQEATTTLGLNPMLLGKLENPEETFGDTERTCKLHTGPYPGRSCCFTM